MVVQTKKNLLERAGELRALASAVDAVRERTGCLLMVEGPGGIGKTALLEEVSTSARDEGVRVVRARGAELEREFAFGVVRQWLEPVVRGLDDVERGALLGGAAGLAAPLLGVGPGDRLPASEDPSFAMLHGLFWVCAGLAEDAPLLIVLDDAHWADAPSLRFVHYLTGRLDGLAIGVIVAFRRGEPCPTDELVGALATQPDARGLRPAPLSAGAVARVVGDSFPDCSDPALARVCHEATGGNPFLLHELVRALHEDGPADSSPLAARVAAYGPQRIADSVLARIAGLSGAAVALARAVAVMGVPTSVDAASALAELDLETGAEAADLLAMAGILELGWKLSFVHPIVRSAIYADLPPAARASGHARAARLLARDGGPPEAAAAQLLEAERAGDQWTVSVLRQAAGRALAGGAPESAAAYLARALEEPPAHGERAAVLRELGAAEAVSHHPAAVEHLADALALTPEPAERARLALELASAFMVAGRGEQAVELLDEALAELGGRAPELAMRIEAQLLGATGQSLSTRPLHARRLARLRETPLGDGPADRMLLANLASWAGMEGMPASAVSALAERALGGGRLLSEVTADSPVLYLAINALLYADRLEPSLRRLDEAVADARARGSIIGYALSCAFRAEAHYRVGAVTEAQADARAALDAGGPEWGLLPYALAPLVRALVDRGELEAADRALAAHGDAPERIDGFAWKYLLLARGRLRLVQDRPEEAVHELLGLGRWLEACGVRNPGGAAWRSLAAAALGQLGERDEARRLADEEVILAQPLGQPRTLGIALRVAGRLSEAPIEPLREAASVLEHSGARLEHARALVELGAALRRASHRRDARPVLREALHLAHRCRAPALAERARHELLATGARPRRPALTGRDALTPTEARVARMAAEGQSTPAIAQALFVTPKTVETHLGHAYLKLDVHSRRELAAALAAPDDD
jgi:DNA-binding CsgD family transcriptional regulator